MNIINLSEKGIILKDKNKKGLFRWELIKYISVGEIDMGYLTGESQKIIDLIYKLEQNIINIIRIKEENIKYGLLFKNPEDERRDNFQKLINILVKYSNSSISFPNNNNAQDTGPDFYKYPDLKSYEANIISSFV